MMLPISALGVPLERAIRLAQTYVRHFLRHALSLSQYKKSSLSAASLLHFLSQNGIR